MNGVFPNVPFGHQMSLYDKESYNTAACFRLGRMKGNFRLFYFARMEKSIQVRKAVHWCIEGRQGEERRVAESY